MTTHDMQHEQHELAQSDPHTGAAATPPDKAQTPRLHAAIAWPVHTERLTLRPPTIHDAETTWQFRRLPEVGRWLTEEHSDVDAYRDLFLTRNRFATTVVVEVDAHVIGDLMLDIQDAWGQAEVADRAKGTQAELGWVLHPDHTGHGYATEAVRALLDIAFNGLGLRRVTAACFAANEASWRLMERLGMRRETHNVRDSLHRSGDWLDGMVHALLAEEHQAAAPRGDAVSKPANHLAATPRQP